MADNLVEVKTVFSPVSSVNKYCHLPIRSFGWRASKNMRYGLDVTPGSSRLIVARDVRGYPQWLGCGASRQTTSQHHMSRSIAACWLWRHKRCVPSGNLLRFAKPWPIEQVDLPKFKMVIFHGLPGYQRLNRSQSQQAVSGCQRMTTWQLRKGDTTGRLAAEGATASWNWRPSEISTIFYEMIGKWVNRNQWY